MKQTHLCAALVSTMLFAFGSESVAQTKHEKIQSEQDKNKPKIITLKSGEPTEFTYDGGTVKYLASSEDTSGAWSLVELKEMPGYKTNLHRHNNSDEAFLCAGRSTDRQPQRQNL